MKVMETVVIQKMILVFVARKNSKLLVIVSKAWQNVERVAVNILHKTSM